MYLFQSPINFIISSSPIYIPQLFFVFLTLPFFPWQYFLACSFEIKLLSPSVHLFFNFFEINLSRSYRRTQLFSTSPSLFCKNSLPDIKCNLIDQSTSWPTRRPPNPPLPSRCSSKLVHFMFVHLSSPATFYFVVCFGTSLPPTKLPAGNFKD
jgi:hypothetical protein